MVPHLLEAVDYARAMAETDMVIDDDSDVNWLVYTQNRERIEAAAARLDDWISAGAEAKSGVETVYNQPSDSDRDDAVATTIFAFWTSAFQERLMGDLNLIPAHRMTDDNTVGRFIDGLLTGRGPEP